MLPGTLAVPTELRAGAGPNRRLFQEPPDNMVHRILTTEMFSISSKKRPQNRNKQKVESVNLRTTKTQHDLN